VLLLAISFLGFCCSYFFLEVFEGDVLRLGCALENIFLIFFFKDFQRLVFVFFKGLIIIVLHHGIEMILRLKEQHLLCDLS